MYVTSKSPVGDQSGVALIRTATTLDRRTSAEKVSLVQSGGRLQIMFKQQLVMPVSEVYGHGRRLFVHAHTHTYQRFARLWQGEARELTASSEITLWMTLPEAPSALQSSEYGELPNPVRARCGISERH